MERKPHFTQTGVRHATINGHRFHLRLTDPTDENFLWIDGKSPPLVTANSLLSVLFAKNVKRKTVQSDSKNMIKHITMGGKICADF